MVLVAVEARIALALYFNRSRNWRRSIRSHRWDRKDVGRYRSR